MSGVEFTPLGLVAAGDGVLVASQLNLTRQDGHITADEANAARRRVAIIETTGRDVTDEPRAALPFALTPPEFVEPKRAAPLAQPAPHAPLAPRDLVREAKARIKAIDVELRRLTALRRERDELQRLVTAAKRRPANVTPLSRRSTG